MSPAYALLLETPASLNTKGLKATSVFPLQSPRQGLVIVGGLLWLHDILMHIS